MFFLWIYCVVVFLCCNSQIDVVLAGKKQFGLKDIFKWIDTSYKDGSGESWDERTTGEKRIGTEIIGESWFITPIMGKSNISYLNVSAYPTKCGGKSTCSLIIYGTTKTLRTSDLPQSTDTDRRKYISNNFEMISKINFTLNKRTSNISDVITKSYQRLAIFTGNTSKQQTWAIYSIELYYYFCETSMTTNSNRVVLKQTNSSTTDVNVQAKCANNAVTNDGKMNISVNCSVKGTWIVGNNESCSCDKGFGLDNSKCSPCKNDYYKAEISNTQCSKCPPGKTNNATRTTCRCKDNHYIGEDKTVNGSCIERTTERPNKTTVTTTSGTTSVPKERGESKNKMMFIYVGAGVGVLIVLLIVLIVIAKSRRAKSNKDGSDNLGFESVALPTIGQRMYVDPSNYDDPEAAVKDFANEISPKSLLLERVLGGGEFGDVYKGTLKTEDGGVLDVAAKTLKHDSDERSRKDFFMEASAMGQFDDPNVIHLEGVITKSVPHMIVTEYMSNGSLDHFLKQNDDNLTDLQLVGMARGVASGMRYLAAMHFVHRDLAARNILVTDTLLCKVADFGLSRELETADSSRGEYCTTGGKIPVRWTAPESIKYRKFSTASDVWSYGILLWEIMAFAERPYWDWDNFKVLERVDEGYRLAAPKNCPKAVHDLMLLCWESDRSQRPQFADIVRMLDDWIRSPETIRYEKIKSIPRPGSGTINDPSILIKEWLNDIKMSSYIPHFTQAGFKQLSDLAGLLDSDLQAIGVTLIGHRNKMLRTIRSLPITDGSKKSPWNRATSFKI